MAVLVGIFLFVVYVIYVLVSLDVPVALRELDGPLAGEVQGVGIVDGNGTVFVHVAVVARHKLHRVSGQGGGVVPGDRFRIHNGPGVLLRAVQLVGVLDVVVQFGGIGHILPLKASETAAAAVLNGALDVPGGLGDGEPVNDQGLLAALVEVDPQDAPGRGGQLDGDGADGAGLEALAACIVGRLIVDVEIVGVVQLAVAALVVQGEVDPAPAVLKGMELDHIQVLPAGDGGGVDLMVRDLAAVFQPEPLAGIGGLSGQIVVHVVSRSGNGHEPQDQGQGKYKAQDPA